MLYRKILGSKIIYIETFANIKTKLQQEINLSFRRSLYCSMAFNEKIISKSNRWGMDLLMIFVTLGTQDKKFPRLLQALDKAIEKGEIEEKVIVQAGNTKYESENMDIFDLISPDEFNKYIDDCDILITHGGVGSIITAVKKEKK